MATFLLTLLLLGFFLYVFAALGGGTSRQQEIDKATAAAAVLEIWSYTGDRLWTFEEVMAANEAARLDPAGAAERLETYRRDTLAGWLVAIEARYQPAVVQPQQATRRGGGRNDAARQRAMGNRLAHAASGRKTWRGNMWGR